jgi:phosphatidylglycerol:prolipoprotein diacylglycerol transferase
METGNIYLALANAIFLSGMVWRHKKMNVSREFALGLAIGMLLAGAIGARLFYVAIHRVPLSEGLSLVSAHRGGFSFIGAIIGATAALLAICTAGRKSLSEIGSEAVTVWCFSSIFWRMRCHFNGCCHGEITTNPVWHELSRLSGSGAPGTIPLPALEMLLLSALTLWLISGITFLSTGWHCKNETVHRLKIASYFIVYGLFRLVTKTI